MAELVRHRQTKGSATDRLHLNHRATPRLHTMRISPIPGAGSWDPSLGARVTRAGIRKREGTPLGRVRRDLGAGVPCPERNDARVCGPLPTENVLEKSLAWLLASWGIPRPALTWWPPFPMTCEKISATHRQFFFPSGAERMTRSQMRRWHSPFIHAPACG